MVMARVVVVMVVVVVAYLSCAKVGWQWASIKEVFFFFFFEL